MDHSQLVLDSGWIDFRSEGVVIRMHLLLHGLIVGRKAKRPARRAPISA
jgi:hypothetical protein